MMTAMLVAAPLLPTPGLAPDKPHCATAPTCSRVYGGTALPDHCSVTGTQSCPTDQASIDNCPTC